MGRLRWRTVRRQMSEMPLGLRLYTFFWTLYLPAGLVLLFLGAVVPGLVLLVLFVLDHAIVTPLLVARSEKRRGAKS